MSSIDWKEQSIVITGAYGGLGKELCKDLNNKGAQLIITGRNKDKLSALKQSLSNETRMLTGDVVDTGFQTELIQLIKAVKSDSHMLINNAGISHAQFLQSQEIESIKQTLEINLLAPIVLSKVLTPWLQKAKTAKIINIGSTFGAIGYPGFSTYCASKFGLRGFSQALNRELNDTTISVQYLAPRAIATSINSDKVNQLNKALKNKVDTVESLMPQIIKAIEQNKSEKFFGWPEKLFAKLNAILPSIVSGSLAKQHKTIKTYLK